MSGAGKTFFFFFCLLLALFLFLAGARLLRGDRGEELYFYCGAGLRQPADEIVSAFSGETGIRVRTDYGPSSILLGRIKVSGEGDVFMPGDESYVVEAENLGLVRKARTAASWEPVIMAGKGNPRSITGIDSLVEPGVRLALADERAAAIGKISRLVFEKNGISPDEIAPNLVYEGATVHDIAMAVELGHADAAIVWAPVAAAYSGAEIIPVPAGKNVVSPVPVAVLASSRNMQAASLFVDFIVSEAGRKIFQKHGYGGFGNED